MSKFSERFSKLKENSGKTLKELSSDEELAISISNLSYYMNGREPNFDTLCKIAEYFGVTIDYLVGKSDNMTLKDEVADKLINAENETLSTINRERVEQIKNLSTKLYNELTLAANEEIQAKKDYIIWEIVEVFLNAINSYRKVLKESESYPLDAALESMNNFEKVEYLAFKPIKSMIETLIKDPDADESLKNRVGIKMAYRIKDNK